MSSRYDVVIVGTGPAGLGAAFALLEGRRDLRLLLIDRLKHSSGGLRNDCKMNFTYPVGFPAEYWTREESVGYLEEVLSILDPPLLPRTRLDVYARRAQRLGTELLDIRQAHLGTDGGLKLIGKLVSRLEEMGAEFSLGETVLSVDPDAERVDTDRRRIEFDHLIMAPGRQGFNFLQETMKSLGVIYADNVVDVGIRVETRVENYPIVRDYYDPKFLFPEKVRTFCTNSGAAYVVQEKYSAQDESIFYSVNGHAWSERRKNNGLVNFAMLRTVRLTEPLASGHRYAEILGRQASLLGGGKPIMQRVGDFRLGKRSRRETFTGDLYDFEPTLSSCTPGDISLAMPAKILRTIWRSMKSLDTVIPGVLHPSTILYYPEIKLYANKPEFIDGFFRVTPGIFMIGDGAGTSRGITGAWASGIRAGRGILGTD